MIPGIVASARLVAVVGDIDATEVSYTPDTPSDWGSPQPETVQEALDELGGRSGGGGPAAVTRYTKSATWSMTDGSAIVVGSPSFAGTQTLQADGDIVRWVVSGHGGGGTCEIGVYSCAFADGPPTSGDSITGGNNPEIFAASPSYDQAESVSFSGWTTAITAGHQIDFALLASSSFTKITITMEIER